MTSLERRHFIKSGTVFAGALIGSSLVSLPLCSTANALAADNEPIFEESSCRHAKKKILVGYESLFGSTSGVAAQMADILCQKGFSVDLLKIDHVKKLSQYDGAVIGSAVKSAAWNPLAIQFVQDNKDELKKIPVFYFLTCIALYSNSKRAKALAQTYFDPVLTKVPEIRPVCAQAFAGSLDYSKMNMIYRMIMKSKMSEKGIPEGDYRNFEKIRTWTLNSVLPHLV